MNILNPDVDTRLVEKDELWGHRWGYKDTFFVVNDDRTVRLQGSRYNISGYDMPYLIPFAEEMLNLPFDSQQVRPEIHPSLPPSKVNKEFVTAVARVLGKKALVFNDEDRLLHSHGQTTADEVFKVLYGQSFERYADAVYYCESEKDAQKCIKLAHLHRVCVVPYGGGTSVSAALRLPHGERRMIVVLNTLGLNHVHELDSTNMTVSVGAGVRGRVLEDFLNEKGFTLGHEPDSLELSTVGGWISTNASGMKRGRYGNIDDLIRNVNLVTAQGELVSYGNFPRISGGVDMRKLLLGSEGNFGLITRATLSIFPMPRVKKYESILFHDFETGVAFLQDLRDSGIRIASVRLVDNTQFKFGLALRPYPHGLKKKCMRWIEQRVLSLKGLDKDRMSAATVIFEGDTQEVKAQLKQVKKLVSRYKGFLAGSHNGERGYQLTYAIAYIRDLFADYYIIGETYETTVPWEHIHRVCKAVKEKSLECQRKYGFPGTPFVSPRITQIYQTGVCIYFTHGLSCLGVDNPENKFSQLEKEIRKCILDNGGSISHHHGVGKLRSQFMNQIQSEHSIDVIKSFKKTLDPSNVFGIGNNIFAR